MATTDTEWLRVGAAPETLLEVDEIVSSGVFTRAQILRAGLALGVKRIKSDPSVLLPNGARKPSK